MAKLEDIIKARGEERTQSKLSREDAYVKHSVELCSQIIRDYGERVGKMLDVMKMIKDNDPELWKIIRCEKFDHIEGYKSPIYFYTNGWSHQLGFFVELNAIGYEAGGLVEMLVLRLQKTIARLK